MKKENKHIKAAAEKVSDIKEKNEKLKAIAVEISELIDKYNLSKDEEESILFDLYAGTIARPIVDCPINMQYAMFGSFIEQVKFILELYRDFLSQYFKDNKPR